jgi:RNA polymerase sigma-70 factor (ECF subfamily)
MGDGVEAWVRAVAGSRVAYATIGSGPPLGSAPASFGRLSLNPESERVRVDDPVDAGVGAPRRERPEPERVGDHVGRLYRGAYGLCGSREGAEALVQETFERVLRRPRFIRREQDLVYLMRVLRDTWIGSERARRVAAVSLDGEGLAPAARAEYPAATVRVFDGGGVYEALRALTEPLRVAVVAVDVVGLSYRDAARALGVGEGTVMSRLYRGRSQIAAGLQAV